MQEATLPLGVRVSKGTLLHLNMSHTRNDSKDSNASETVSDAQSIISFSEGVLRTMEDERFSTERFVYEANKCRDDSQFT